VEEVLLAHDMVALRASCPSSTRGRMKPCWCHASIVTTSQWLVIR